MQEFWINVYNVNGQLLLGTELSLHSSNHMIKLCSSSIPYRIHVKMKSIRTTGREMLERTSFVTFRDEEFKNNSRKWMDF